MKSKLIKKKPLPLFLMSIKSEIRLDPLPGAIIWVESLLRPQLIRYFEYFNYKLNFLLNSDHLTLGLAQLKVKYWKEFSIVEDFCMSIRSFENPVLNFKAVKWYLSHFEYKSLLDVSKIYTGRDNVYYASLLQEALYYLNIVNNKK